MNLIRSTLVTMRANFIVGCAQTLFYLAGFGLLFSVGWKIGLGSLLVWWASLLQLRTR